MGFKYLVRSKTGWYSYRRRVPSHLHKIIGKREFKQRLETKDETVAIARLGQINVEVSAKLKIAERLASAPSPETETEALSAA